MRFLFTLTFLLSPTAHAEYRAFELAIVDQSTGTERRVASILDDIQYPGYYPLRKNEVIQIAATWMCWGRRDYFQPICTNPKAAPEQKTNSSPTSALAPSS